MRALGALLAGTSLLAVTTGCELIQTLPSAHGCVVDARSGKPLANAKVIRVWEGESKRKTADTNGQFKFHGRWRLQPAIGDTIRADRTYQIEAEGYSTFTTNRITHGWANQGSEKDDLGVIRLIPVTGYRSGDTKPGPNDCDFICFEDVGLVNYWNYPFTVCIDDPSPELKNCIAKYLHDDPVSDLGPQDTLLDIVKISPGDFKEIEILMSGFVSNAKGQLRWHGESGTVGVTIVYESKVQSKDIGPVDYKLLLNQIPVEILQRNPELATGLRRMIKGPPLRGNN